MFKLLRRSKNRKSKKLSPELEVPRNSANQTKIEQQNIGVERYRQFSETENDKPTTLIHSTINSQDKSLRECGVEDLQILQIENANRPTVSVSPSYSNHDNQGKYEYDKFHSNRRANEKVILAKTAAIENTPTSKIDANSATKPKQNRKVFAFNKNNVEKINKIVSATALGVCADDDDEDRNERHDRSGDGAADEHENVVGDVDGHLATLRESSQNVDAEWQGHVFRSIRKRDKIEKSIEQHKNNTKIATNTTLTSNVKNAKEVVDTTIRTANIKDTSTANTANTVINEVKYRNLDKSNSESKRLSRLSLTLGLSLGVTKSKRESENYPLSTRSESGSQVKRSFFRRKSKSVDNEEEFINYNNLETPFCAKTKEKLEKKGKTKSKTEQTVAGDRAQRALEKSRTFLSDIFMARGRHQQRNRNNQQLQQQQQQTETTHSSSTKLQEQPIKYSAVNVSSHIYNGNNTNKNSNNSNHNDHVINVRNDQKNSEENVPHHLETVSNPLSTSTNSYQMTTAINRHGNVSQEKVKKEQHQSNSAQRVRSDSMRKALTEESHADHQTAGASKTNTSQSAHEESTSLNRINGDEQQVIHSPNIKANGTNTANSSKIELKDQRDGVHQFQSGRREFSSAKSDDTSERGFRDKRQLNELTECDRDSLVLHCAAIDEQNIAKAYNKNKNNNCKSNVLCLNSMGQTNAKSETPPTSRASTPREFRESVVSSEQNKKSYERPEVVVPKITVVDYSDSGSSGNGSPVEQEVYYDFDVEKSNTRLKESVDITAVEDDDDGIEDDVFHEPDSKPNKRVSPLRHNYARLEDVPEQDEEENGEIGMHRENNKHDVDDRNLDNELYNNDCERNGRIPSKSTNTSDSNLSACCPDSGIGDSQASPSRLARFLLGDNELSPARSTRTMSPQQQHLPFVRDGYSTDCDETLLPCDDLDFVIEEGELDVPERLVCIESISLPDVVVESTASSASAIASSSNTSSAVDANGEHIVNINGATGNNMGNVHFIPIHVEGDNSNAPGSSQKRRSVDDSFIGTSGRNSPFKDRSQTIVEIVEDENDYAKKGKSNGHVVDAIATEKFKRELVEQKSRFNVQLEDAHKNVQNLHSKINEMQTKIENLEQEMSLKAWNVERLQGELNAAHKDDEYVRKRLKSLEDEKTNLRHKCNESEQDFKRRLEELEKQYKELEEKYKHTQSLASSLQSQLITAQKEANQWREEVETIRAELEEQTRILKNALENSEAERKICQDKWQKQFEILRTQNMDREEALMTDCEWQLRQLKKHCKDKVDKTEHERNKVLKNAEELERNMGRLQEQVDGLKSYQAEVKSMRSIIAEQETTIQSLVEQIEQLKTDLRTANESLEEQIEAVRKIKYQCNNALCDKERQMIYRIDEVRNEAAAFWENKLYTEMTRLKNELESVYVDERRDALDKLQGEHIEELRALTTRYTANEEELRIELNELQERFEKKNEEFMDLREKSDNALLQTRMHLDRADREFQNAMCREEDRREALEESLRKEFEAEKQEMEERFCERLTHVREEFEKELKSSTKGMVQQHKKELETQKAKLQAEKDEAIQELAERHRKKLAAAEDQLQELELRHQRDLKDLKEEYDSDKTIMDKRDMSNANEIEQLHRKCRCLTNLFEEMRIRYERRDPRPEDLNEIKELRSRCESQEQDLYILTDRLRELQNKMMEMQENNSNQQSKKTKSVKKPPPKTIPLTCDVIYEENEERESPPPEPLECPISLVDEDGEEEEEDSENDESNNVIVTLPAPISSLNNGISKHASDRINEDDSHMVTTV